MTEKTKGTMGLLSAVSIGVGGMVGAGIFSIIGVAVGVAGSATAVSFLLAGLAAMLSAYSYGRLGARFPSAGGPVEYLLRGLGDTTVTGGFNLMLWFGYVLALALYANAFAGYGATFLPGGGSPLWKDVLAACVMALFTLVNYVGARAVGRAELVIVAIKVAILVLFAAAGLAFAHPAALAPGTWPQAPSILYAAGIVFLGYEGFGLVTNAAEDMADPARTLPRAIFISVLLVIVLYVAVALAVVGNLSPQRIVAAKEYALAAAAEPFLGKAGFTAIAVAALFSTASAINATLYGGANVCWMIARRGELPLPFRRKQWDSDREGLLLTAGLATLFAVTLDLEGIALMGSAAFLLVYGAVNVAHLRLLKETGARPWLIRAAVASCAAFGAVLGDYVYHEQPKVLVLLGALAASCFMAEGLYRRFRPRTMAPRGD